MKNFKVKAINKAFQSLIHISENKKNLICYFETEDIKDFKYFYDEYSNKNGYKFQFVVEVDGYSIPYNGNIKNMIYCFNNEKSQYEKFGVDNPEGNKIAFTVEFKII